MIKANVILDHYKWKHKIKNPALYLKKKINKLNKIRSFKKKQCEFSISQMRLCAIVLNINVLKTYKAASLLIELNALLPHQI